MKIGVVEIQRSWGKRGTTIRLGGPRRASPVLLEFTASVVQLLPVAPQDRKRKAALVREMKKVLREWQALEQRLDVLTEAFEAAVRPERSTGAGSPRISVPRAWLGAAGVGRRCHRACLQ